jgi:transposase-like protein
MHSKNSAPHQLMLLIDRLRRSRFTHGLRCPRCGSNRIRLWGWFSGRQRYRCAGCKRTFSDLTATPAAYVKKLELFTAYCACLEEGLSIRSAAARMGVHPSTAFRWRHALLSRLHASEPDRLDGWIEFDWVLFAYSRKGERKLHRRPRSRAIPHGFRTHDPRVSVWAACDRRGRVISGMVVASRPTVNSVDDDLAGHVQPSSIFTARHGSFGPAAALARRKGGRFFDPMRAPSTAHLILYEFKIVSSYLRRLRTWMFRFRGVATRYLANYLLWHRFLDRTFRFALPAALLQWYEPIDSAIRSGTDMPR